MEGLREFLMSWKGKVILAICVAPMALLGLESFFQSTNNPNDIAKVGKTAIDTSTYQNALNTRLEMLTQAVKDASLIKQDVLKDQVLQGLIDRTLLDNQMNKLGMTVSDEAITDYLKQDPAFLDANNQFSNDKFGEFLRSRGMTKDQLFATIRSQNALRQFTSNIANTAIYPMAGIIGILDLQLQQRPVWVARLPWQTYANQVTVTDKEISDYFTAHPDAMKSQAMVDLTALTVDKSQLNVPAVTDSELKQQYDAYVKSQTADVQYDVAMILVGGEKAQNTINAVKSQLDSKKADFATLAKQYSQDDGSKNNGGNIGTISKEMFPQDYDKVLKAIKGLKEGEITAPIQTQYGYQIFKLNKIDGTTPPSLDSVRDTMLTQATEKKREATYQALVKQLNDMAAAGQNLKDMAGKLNLTAQTFKDYPKENNTTALNQPAVLSTVFDDVLLKEGNTAVGVDLKGKTVWVQPANYRPVKTLTLAEATPQIRTTLIQNKAKELALADAKKIASQVAQANSMTVTLPTGVSFMSLGNVTRQNDKLLTEEKSAAFSQTASGDKFAVTTAMTSQGASILVGGAMENSALQIPAKTKIETAQKIRDNMGDAQLQDYLHYLRSINEININQAALKSPAP